MEQRTMLVIVLYGISKPPRNSNNDYDDDDNGNRQEHAH